ncbi:MAG: hypothetical protein WD448_04890, partial [Woeseia sp.]
MNGSNDPVKEADRRYVLHPFTQLREFDAGEIEPFVVETGSGARIRGSDGTELLDAFAGLYCVNIGYGRIEVAEAISKQA